MDDVELDEIARKREVDRLNLIVSLKNDGFTDEHFEELKGTNKCIIIELGYFYGVGTDKPIMGKSTLYNIFINGKNYWRYNRNYGCIGTDLTFACEGTIDSLFRKDEVYEELLRHPDFSVLVDSYIRNEKPVHEIIGLPRQRLFIKDRLRVYREGNGMVIITMDHTGKIDQYIKLSKEGFESIRKWFYEV